MDKEVIVSCPIKGRKELFDLIDEYIDEHYNDIFEIINQKLNHYVTSATLFPYGHKAIPIEFDIDTDEHIWYNKFNKWNWTKFENGVIKIDKI